MDLRKKSIAESIDSFTEKLSPTDAVAKSSTSEPTGPFAVPTALARIASFSAALAEVCRRKDREAIRALVAEHAATMLNAETAQVFFSALEAAEPSVIRVFETAGNRARPRAVGDEECLAQVQGAGGAVLAVIRVSDKREWEAFTADDVALLEAMATHLGLVLENLRLAGELLRQQESSIQALAAAIEVKDRYTAGHTKRVGTYADILSDRLPVIDSEKEKIRLAGVLHDIGKIGVPDRILLKPEALTRGEWEEMRLHTEAGFDIVSRVAGLEEIAEILRHHHERWNGTGYPRGLKAEAIPFPSRVIAVADTFDAIVTNRPYRVAMTPEQARDIIVGLSGIHFDPVVVDAFIAGFSKLREAALNPEAD
jgi:HD-GYP domain-containing protein (c-di-GMP phosphodiesterase class II)